MSSLDFKIARVAEIRVKKNSNGHTGEKLVQAILKAQNGVKKVIPWFERDQRIGYDLEALHRDGSSKKYEVKSSQQPKFTPSKWYVPAKQHRLSRDDTDYSFWFINGVNSSQPSILQYQHSDLKFRPGRYSVSIDSRVAPNRITAFDATDLIAELEKYEPDSQECHSRSSQAGSSVPRYQIARSIKTRAFLYEKLPKRHCKDFSSVQYNPEQANARVPYHLQYKDAEGKEVSVDLKVVEGPDPRLHQGSHRFFMTSNRLNQAINIQPDSNQRREFWLCTLDRYTQRLFVQIYDISGKEFWAQRGVSKDIDCYSFSVKKKAQKS